MSTTFDEQYRKEQLWLRARGWRLVSTASGYVYKHQELGDTEAQAFTKEAHAIALKTQRDFGRENGIVFEDDEISEALPESLRSNASENGAETSPLGQDDDEQSGADSSTGAEEGTAVDAPAGEAGHGGPGLADFDVEQAIAELPDPPISDPGEEIEREMEFGPCEKCGCTDLNACEGGCSWVRPGLCSKCDDSTHNVLGGQSDEEDESDTPSWFDTSLSDSGDIPGHTCEIDPHKVTTHPSTMMRAGGLDQEHVDSIAAALEAGKKIPPVDLFFDAFNYYIGDGNHRHAGALQAGAKLDAVIHKGTLRDAILFAVRANAEHGLKRSNDDKRLAVVTILEDPEWSHLSDTQIAEMADVTQPFVSKVQNWLEKFFTEGDSEIEYIPDGLVAIVNRLDEMSRNHLTQNVMSRAESRIGKDGRKYNVEEPAENTAPLLESTGAPESEAEADPDAAGEPVETSAKLDAQQPEPLHKFHRLVEFLKARPETVDIDALNEAGFSTNEVNEARTAGVIKKGNYGKYFYDWTSVDIARAVQEAGEITRGGLEELGCPSVKIAGAIAEGVITQKEPGVFIATETSDASVADAHEPQETAESLQTSQLSTKAEQKKPERSPISSQLKEQMLVVSVTWIPALKSKLSVSVKLGDDAAGAARMVIEETELRLPESVLKTIEAQIQMDKSKPGASKTPVKKAAKKAPAKAAKKPPVKRAAKKAPAQAAAKKKPARKATAQV